MTEWSTVGAERPRRKRKPKPAHDVAKDVEMLLWSSAVAWTPEQIQDALHYPSMQDVWDALDGPLARTATRRKNKWSIE